MSRMFDRMAPWKTALLAAALAVLAFGPFIGNAFVALDDDYLIYNNPAVKTMSWSGITHVFSSYDPQLYIPFTFLSFQLNAAMFGLNPAAFHLINVLLHALSAALLFLILRRLTKNDFVSALAAMLFAVHPLNAEAVLWAAGRKDVLSGVFFFLSTLWYLKFRERDERKLLWLSVVFYLFGLLSKVSVVPLPVWLLMIDWFERRPVTKKMFTEKLPYFGLAIVFGIVAIIGKSRLLAQYGDVANSLLPLQSAVFYLTKIVAPIGFSVIYPYSPGSSPLWQFGPSVLVLLLVAALFLWSVVRGHRFFAFCIITYFLFLGPSFTTFWKNGSTFFASDRYAYLACIGALCIIATLFDRLRRTSGARTSSIVFAVVVAVLIPLSWKQAAVWRDSEALYRNVLSLYPRSVMAETNLGIILQQKGDLKEAREHYETAIRIDPRPVHAYFNLASLSRKEGKEQEAVAYDVKVVDMLDAQQITNANELKPFLWLVEKLEAVGKPADAKRLLDKLVSFVPNLPEIHAFIGLRERKNGNGDAALKELSLAETLGSDDPEVYMALAEIWSDLNRPEDVIRVLRKLLELDPTNETAKKYLQALQS